MDTAPLDTLQPLISDFVQVHFKKYDNLLKCNVVALFCSSSSTLRKDYTLQRVREIIEQNQLPLYVTDKDIEFTNHFLIKIKT